MKKYLFFGLILFSSLFLTACTNQKTNSNPQSENTPNTKQEENSSFSLRDLIAKNIPQKCTYTGSSQDGTFESEIIISGKKFNQTIKTKSADGDQTINSVSDGEYIYTWGSHTTGGTFAMKLKADFDKQVTPIADKTAGQEVAESQVDLDTNYQGKCNTTIVSDSDFQPPKDVKFQDYSEMMNQIQKMIPSGVKIPEQ